MFVVIADTTIGLIDERINIIADKNSFQEFDSSLSPTDPLGFKDRRAYADRIKESQAGTGCLLYTSPSPRDKRQSRMPSSA